MKEKKYSFYLLDYLPNHLFCRRLKNVDLEFWEIIYDSDLEEALDEYVRDSSNFS